MMNLLRNFAKEKYRLDVYVKIAYVERMNFLDDGIDSRALEMFISI